MLKRTNFFHIFDSDLNNFNEVFPRLRPDNQSEYNNINNFNEIECNHNVDLAIVHVNIRSHNANFDAMNS